MPTHLSSDFVNGMFELFGALMNFRSCLTLLRDRHVAGVNISSTAFFTCWGVFNLAFYPLHGLVWSLAGALNIVVWNSVWVGLAIYFKKKN